MTVHKKFKMADRSPVYGAKRAADGYLIAECRVARSGVMIYDRSEFDLEGDGILRVYRSPEDARDTNALRTMSHAPVTVGHPMEFVDADNWKQLAVGEVSTEVKWEDDHLSVPLILKDAAAIRAVEDGTRELSPGYYCDIEFTDGVSPEGEEYDAIQTNVRINHLAIVDVARGGEKCRIGDRNSAPWGAAPQPTQEAVSKGRRVSDKALQTIVVDGLNVDCTDAGAQAIKKLQAELGDAKKAMGDAKTAHDAAIAEKDKELGAKDAEIADLKSKVVDGAKLDELAAARSVLMDAAKAVAPDLDMKGLSDGEIRKKAVAAKLGDEAVADRSDDYVAGLFDHLSANVEKTTATDSKPFAQPVKVADQGAGGWGKALSTAGVAKQEA